MEDIDLIMEVRTGNEVAFAMLYEKYHRELYVFAYHFLNSSTQAQDVVQNTFFVLWDKRHSIVPDLSLRSYLYSITKYHVLTLLRNASVEKQRALDYYKSLEHSQNEEINHVSHNTLLKSIESLPNRRKEICLLKLMGYSNSRIAIRLGISEKTVKNTYTQIVKQLRDLLSDE